MKHIVNRLRILGALLAVTGTLFAADPPVLVNYQGVLRDSAGSPLDGSHDMVFRFYDLAAGGSEILVDEHLAVGSGAVTADGGMFNVALGGGTVIDGSGVGTYASLAEVFRDHGDVWLEIEVGGEVLSPRTEVRATPYAHNASSLGGRDASDFLDSSSASQVKTGDLAVRDLTLNGNNLFFNGGFSRLIYSNDRFELDDDLFVSRSTGPQLELNDSHVLPLLAQPILRFSTSEATADLSWSPSNSFRLNDSLFVDGAIIASAHLDVGTSAYVSDRLYVNSDGPEGDGLVYFYENGSLSGETLRWDDANDRFELSDEVYAEQLSGDWIYASRDLFPQIELHDPNALPLDAQPGIRFSTPGGSKALSWASYLNEFRFTDNVAVYGYLDAYELSSTGDVKVNRGGPDSDSHLYFRDGGSDTGEYLRWNDAANQFELSNVLHGPPSNNFWLKTDSNLRVMFDDDNSTTGNLAEWFHDGTFTNANKLAELQEDGDFRIRKTLSQNVAFDLAESFWASELLGPGDLVRADPDRPGAVLRAVEGDPGVLGVVSGLPGVLLGSAPFDADSLRTTWGEQVHASFVAEREELRARVMDRAPDLREAEEVIALLERRAGEPDSLPADPEDERAVIADLRAQVAARRHALDERIESLALELFAEEHLVPVALAGRVPVRVDADVAPIAVGDPLTAGPIPGTAVRADGSAPAVGIALEPLASGQGTVLAFVTRFETSGAALAAIEERQSGLESTVRDRTPDPLTGVQSVPGDLQVVLDGNADADARFSIHRDGRTDGELGAEVFRVDEQGNVFARGAFRPHAMDLAEFFPVSEPVSAGDVLAIDLDHPGSFRRAATTADSGVVGIVSTVPGVVLGGSVQQVAATDADLRAELEAARRAGDSEDEARIWRSLERRFLETHAAVALAGTAPCNVDAGYGAIRPGDLLQASPTPGHAMRATEAVPGTILGKALEGFEAGTGQIRVLVAPPAH